MVVLLGYVLLQAQQSKDYEDLTRQQIMTYLTDHGIAISETHIPWWRTGGRSFWRRRAATWGEIPSRRGACRKTARWRPPGAP